MWEREREGEIRSVEGRLSFKNSAVPLFLFHLILVFHYMSTDSERECVPTMCGFIFLLMNKCVHSLTSICVFVRVRTRALRDEEN